MADDTETKAPVNPYAEAAVTLGDQTVETSQFDRYKGRKGSIDRIAILSSRLIKAYRYYHDGTKTSFRAPDKDPALMDLCRKQLGGEPEQRFALVLFHYATDEAGALTDSSKCSGKVKVWSISESRYEELSNLNKSWPLMDNGWGSPQTDVQIVCSEEKFQRMTLQPHPTAHWKTKESWYRALKEKESKAQDKARASLGRNLGPAEIMALFGASSLNTTGQTANAGNIDLSDVID